MKTIGIVGGIGPESTVDYYRRIIAGHRERITDGSYPLILINSIDLKRVIDHATNGERAQLADYIVDAVAALQRAGADFAIIASNTPHVVFDDVQQRSSLPLISIVEVTRAEAVARGLRRLALFGSRMTMQASFYPDAFAKSGIEIVIPTVADQDYVHEKYFTELVHGIILPETRHGLLDIVHRMDIDGLILGGTELPLILKDGMSDRVPFLDTTEIHVKAAVARMLEE